MPSDDDETSELAYQARRRVEEWDEDTAFTAFDYDMLPEEVRAMSDIFGDGYMVFESLDKAVGFWRGHCFRVYNRKHRMPPAVARELAEAAVRSAVAEYRRRFP